MARLRTLGFEINNSVNPTSGGASGYEWDIITTTGGGFLAPTITTSNVRTGTYAGNISSLASGSLAYFGATVATSNLTVVYVRAYVYFTTLPSAENTIIVLNNTANATTPVVYLTVDNGGLLRLYDEDGQIGSASSALSTGAYYRIEIKMDASAAAGSHVVEAKIAGAAAFASSSTRSLSSGIATVLFGGNLLAEAQTTGDWNFDDIAINDNSGSSQTSYPGSGKVVYLRPNGAGASNTWLKTNRATAGDTSNYTLTNENPPDDTTSFISSSTLNHNDDYVMDNSGIGASDTVNLVVANYRAANSTATAGMGFKLGITKTSGGTYTESAEQGTTFGYLSGFFLTNKENSSTLTMNPVLTLYLDPDGGAWTQTTVDSMQMRAKVTTDGTARFLELTGLWVVVDYTPGGASNYTRNDADTITLSDAATKAIAKPFSDTITLSDAITKAITNTEADTITLSDATSRAIGLSKADTFTLSDAMVNAIGQLSADTLTMSDMATVVMAFVRTADDILTLSDSVSTEAPVHYTQSVADTLSLVDHIEIDFSGQTGWYTKNNDTWYADDPQSWYTKP